MILSVSRLEDLLKCPRKFEFKYIYGFKETPSIALGMGRAFHKAIETNFISRLDDGVFLGETEIKEVGVSSFDSFLKENEITGGDFNREQLQSLLDVFGKSEYAKIEPQLIEKSFDIVIQGVPFTGRIDLLDKNNNLVDFKTSSRAYSQGDVDKALQVSAYLCATESLGLNVDEFIYIVVVKNKKPVLQRLSTKRTKKELEWFSKLVYIVANQIEKGIFPPNPIGFLCSKTYCGYFDLCMDFSS